MQRARISRRPAGRGRAPRAEPVRRQAESRTPAAADLTQIPLEEGAGEGAFDPEAGEPDPDLDGIARVRLQEEDEVVAAPRPLDRDDLDVVAVEDAEAAGGAAAAGRADAEQRGGEGGRRSRYRLLAPARLASRARPRT